jgi:AbiU2
MPAHSKEVVERFCELCDWLFQSWQLRKYLFDENPSLSNLQNPRYEHLFYRLNVITQEYWLHQLAKLHDPAVQGGQNGHINLSIDYMIDYGHWNESTKATLVDLRTEMSTLAKPIKDARNKLLSHNDLEIILSSKELGCFNPGEDETYFSCLHKFASLITETVSGQPFIYDDLVRNDIEVFIQIFSD